MIYNNLRVSVVTSPAKEPVTLDEAREHCRIDDNDSDNYLANLIPTAREIAENFTRRAFVTQTLKRTVDCFPAHHLYLPRPPLQSVTSIVYVDEDGNNQTATGTLYDVDTQSEPGRIILAYEQDWPTVRSHDNAVAITYVAGYGDNRSDVPGSIKQSILELIAHMYENREASSHVALKEIPFGVKSMLWPLRAMTV